MTAYDPAVIREHAEKLFLESGRAPILFTFAGAIIGLVVGLGLGIGLGSLPAGITMGVILVALAGGAGYVAGRSVSARMRLSAQTALGQLEILAKLDAKKSD